VYANYVYIRPIVNCTACVLSRSNKRKSQSVSHFKLSTDIKLEDDGRPVGDCLCPSTPHAHTDRQVENIIHTYIQIYVAPKIRENESEALAHDD